MTEKSVLDGSGPHHARRQNHLERRNIPTTGCIIQRVEQWFRKRVTNDRKVSHCVAFNGVEKFHRIELGVFAQHDCTAGVQHRERGERCRPVHQRRGRNNTSSWRACLFENLADGVEPSVLWVFDRGASI